MTSQTTPASGRRISYVPALDGLRGVSLPGTIYTHFGLFLGYLPTAGPWVRHSGPFTLNIEMFFVLSGALITSLLVTEHQRTGAVALDNFYLRRSRRLAPALIAVVPLLLIAQFALPGNSSTPLGGSALITALFILLFIGNWRLAAGGSLGWMGPAWTLGIEEQFYLTWPAMLRHALDRYWSRRELLLAIWTVVVISVAVSTIIYRGAGWDWTVYITPTQLPPILLGCALGYAIATHDDGWFVKLLRSALVGLAGLVGMVVISLLGYRSFGFLAGGGYVAYAACACLLIGHCFVATESVITRCFAWKPFVVIGQVSYEAYLVHCVVILAVLRVAPRMPVNDQILLDLALIATISGSFYYLIERPIRRRGWKVLVGRGTPAGPAEAIPPARAPRLPVRVGVGWLAGTAAGLAVVLGIGIAVVATAPSSSPPSTTAVQLGTGPGTTIRPPSGPLRGPGGATRKPAHPSGRPRSSTSPPAGVDPTGSSGPTSPASARSSNRPGTGCAGCGGNGNSRPPVPTLTELSPASGSVTGGTQVTILGTGFTRAAQVRFGSLQLPDVTWVNNRTLVVTAPPAQLLRDEAQHPLADLHGLVAQVVVQTAGGRTSGNMLSGFTYL